MDRLTGKGWRLGSTVWAMLAARSGSPASSASHMRKHPTLTGLNLNPRESTWPVALNCSATWAAASIGASISPYRRSSAAAIAWHAVTRPTSPAVAVVVGGRVSESSLTCPSSSAPLDSSTSATANSATARVVVSLRSRARRRVRKALRRTRSVGAPA